MSLSGKVGRWDWLSGRRRVIRRGTKVVFTGEHDIVKKGDIGIVSKVLSEEDRKWWASVWGIPKSRVGRYEVDFDGTVLITSNVRPLGRSTKKKEQKKGRFSLKWWLKTKKEILRR
ncbi:hypothetical protein DRO97_02020 [Archaeoglobales archaeon]|nr:MAG: hypothetical protein DRO97_02020 [Archaeoglobales archaeon]